MTVLAMMQENTELSLANGEHEDEASLSESTHSVRETQPSDIDENEDKEDAESNKETDVKENTDTMSVKRVHKSERRRKDGRSRNRHKEIDAETTYDREIEKREDTSESRQHDSRRDIRHTSSRCSHVVRHSIDGEVVTAVGVYDEDQETNADIDDDLTDDGDFSKITEEDEVCTWV